MKNSEILRAMAANPGSRYLCLRVNVYCIPFSDQWCHIRGLIRAHIINAATYPSYIKGYFVDENALTRAEYE